MRWVSDLIAPFKKLSWRFWISFIVACAVAEGGQFAFERLIESRRDNASFVESAVTFSGLYQKLVTAPRRPVVRHVSLVIIDPARDLPSISAANVCAEREFLSRLLARIEAAQPALIVIDKYFGKNSCEDGDPGTSNLLRTIEAIRESRPVIVGLRTRTIEATEVLHAPGSPASRSYLEESLDFGSSSQSSQSGIVNIVRDNRRLPLQWRVFPSSEAASRGETVDRDTLALAAAKTYDPYMLVQNSMLDRLLQRGEQPFIGFLEPRQFDQMRFFASEVLCGRKLKPSEDWRTCPPALRPELQNRIVLVAEDSPDSDEHYSVVGRVPGYYLQANYIEALLDDRYFTPGGPLFDYGFGFLFILALELILNVYHHKTLKAITLIVALLLISYAALYLLTFHGGLYVDPIPVGGTAVVIKLLGLTYDFVKRSGTPEHSS